MIYSTKDMEGRWKEIARTANSIFFEGKADTTPIKKVRKPNSGIKLGSYKYKPKNKAKSSPNR